MASELFSAGGPDVSVTVTPGGKGIFRIEFDGEVVYDKHENDNKFPDLPVAKALKKQLQERLAAVPVAGDD